MSPLQRTTKLWVHGMAAACISGAGTCLSGLAVGISLKKIGLMVLIQAAISVGAYLRQSPLPPELDSGAGPVEGNT